MRRADTLVPSSRAGPVPALAVMTTCVYATGALRPAEAAPFCSGLAAVCDMTS